MSNYFGTDGFRGEANVDLTVEHAYQIGRFIGWYYGQDHKSKVVIGKDTRRGGYMYEAALVAGLTASGADAYLLHVTTTPSVSYIARTEDFDCGIMISASHNPYYDNGIKLINGQGEKMEDAVIDLVEAYLDGTPATPALCQTRCHRPLRGLLRRPQPLCGLSHLPVPVLLQGNEGRSGLLQRLHLPNGQEYF